MRCKVGDLAFVINDDPGFESNIGRIVKVVSPSRRKGVDWNIEPTSPDHLIYCTTRKKKLRYADAEWSWITTADRDLRPIRDSDGEDQTLTWAPRKQDVPA